MITYNINIIAHKYYQTRYVSTQRDTIIYSGIHTPCPDVFLA